MARILQSLSYKVCSTLLPKFVAIKSSLLLGKSAIFNQYLVAMLFTDLIHKFAHLLDQPWVKSRLYYFCWRNLSHFCWTCPHCQACGFQCNMSELRIDLPFFSKNSLVDYGNKSTKIVRYVKKASEFV